jgi:hypothetical protein
MSLESRIYHSLSIFSLSALSAGSQDFGIQNHHLLSINLICQLCLKVAMSLESRINTHSLFFHYQLCLQVAKILESRIITYFLLI